VIHTLDSSVGTDHLVRGTPEIQTANSSADWEIAHQMIDDEHFLGAGRETGDTKGFSQDHTDHYLPNERPKKRWLKPLSPLVAAPTAYSQSLTNWLKVNSGHDSRHRQEGR
jgi:hypothetical protein